MSIKTQPEVQTIEHIPFAQPHIFDVTSSVKLLWMQEVANDTARLELYFDAGLIREKDSIPKIVKALLLSGTNDQSSTEIQEEIDGRGGYIDIDLGTEFAIVNIYCLKEQMLPIANQVFKAIQNLAFRDSEIQDALTSLSQEFKVSKQKVKSVVSEAFRLHSFADQEDYSWKTELEDFSEPKLVRYKRFWKEYYLQGLIRMTLVGNMEQDEVDALIDLFGKWSKIGSPIYGENFHCEPKRLHIPVKDAVQTAIRIGNFSVAKTNPDRHSFGLLNTILGGYFGSRLMTNIREDKGYTYGIGSGVLDYQNGTSFIVMTEVGNEVVDATLTEMKKEIERLRTELIAPEELTLVKNYMMGQLLRSADGPYAMLDLYNSVDMHNLTLDYYDQAILKINSITSEEIQEIAVKYLNWDDFVIATAG